MKASTRTLLAGCAFGLLASAALPALAHTVTEGAAVQRLEGNLPLALFGITLIAVMLAAPGGIASLRLPRHLPRSRRKT